MKRKKRTYKRRQPQVTVDVSASALGTIPPTVPTDAEIFKRGMMSETFRLLGRECYNIAESRGFWRDGQGNPGSKIALMHSELSEALEAIRKGGPIGAVAEEFADTVIRIMDFCYSQGYDLGGAIVTKIDTNRKRPYMHGGKAF